MVRTMLNHDNFRFNFILTATNNRAYSYDTRQYLGEIHNPKNARPGYNANQLSYYVEEQKYNKISL